MPVVIQQEILRLQIAMYNHVAMAIVHPGNDLLEEPSRFRFLKFAVVYDVIEQLASADIFHDHENIGWGGYHLVQFDYVRMSEQLQVLNFATNFSDHIQALDLLTIQDFNGHLVLRFCVLADFDLPEGPRSQGGPQGVVTYLHQRLGRGCPLVGHCVAPSID